MRKQRAWVGLVPAFGLILVVASTLLQTHLLGATPATPWPGSVPGADSASGSIGAVTRNVTVVLGLLVGWVLLVFGAVLLFAPFSNRRDRPASW